MAFTDAEKYKIIRFLGHPANTLVATSTSYSKIISDRLLNHAAEVETEVRAILTRLASLETGLTEAMSQAGVKKIDDIEFFGASDGGSKLQELRKERKRLVRELSSLLDICAMSGSSMGSVIA